jgi:hypothetical protein
MTKTIKNEEHRKFRIGFMVDVLWHQNYYTGRYYGWDKESRRHVVRFPVDIGYGPQLVALFVKDSNINKSSNYP